jgi:LAO/AO transport system kinase
MSEGGWQDLVKRLCEGEPRALARLITRVENRDPGWQEAMKALYPRSGKARVFGITGSPGAGKSSLANRIAAALVERGHRVGIVAVDPSSPFSGGALLGDRLRMRDVSTATDVFIRSMATRGSLGGLCQGARDVARVLDAAGYDRVLIETVGVGQDEIEVVKAADVVVVVCVPGQGDGVQALKAGIMEIADLFVVNKADLDGAEELVEDIQAMLMLRVDSPHQAPSVLRTCALSGAGMPELVAALAERCETEVRLEERAVLRAREEILTLVEGELAQLVRRRAAAGGYLDTAAEQVRSGEIDPYSAAAAIVRGLMPME